MRALMGNLRADPDAERAPLRRGDAQPRREILDDADRYLDDVSTDGSLEPNSSDDDESSSPPPPAPAEN